ncbi:hypothetical protein C1S81_04410 [Mycolicibacterium neoaurum]|nr:hypothetical protein C1S81_04410 [Mycolicibacterium neoaurum]
MTRPGAYDLGISRMLFRTSCISSVCRTLGVVSDGPRGPNATGARRSEIQPVPVTPGTTDPAPGEPEFPGPPDR